MLKMFRENDSPHTKEWELATKFPEVATKDPERNKEELTESIRELEAMLNELTQTGILEKGANVNTQGGVFSTNTTLHVACHGGHKKIVQILLKKGVNR